MTLNDVRAAIVEKLKADAALAALKVDCQTHRGRITVDDLKATSLKPLSVLISFLAVKSVEILAGEVNCNCVWGAFIIAVDKPQLSRDAAALMVLTRLLTLVPGNVWGLGISAPENVEAMNLYNGKMDEKGVVITALTWEQVVSLTLNDAGELDDFLKFVADYDLSPADGTPEAQDNITLPGPPKPEE
jgi:hypothetical protein